MVVENGPQLAMGDEFLFFFFQSGVGRLCHLCLARPGGSSLCPNLTVSDDARIMYREPCVAHLRPCLASLVVPIRSEREGVSRFLVSEVISNSMVAVKVTGICVAHRLGRSKRTRMNPDGFRCRLTALVVLWLSSKA